MIFDEIENSASGYPSEQDANRPLISCSSGYPSEQDIKGLFADFDTTSNRLGNTVKDKNAEKGRHRYICWNSLLQN